MTENPFLSVFNIYSAALCFFLKIIKNTPKRIKITPIIILKVNCSWKNNTPKNIAVKGSKAPKRAVVVEPMIFIAIVIVSREIIVGITESPIA